MSNQEGGPLAKLFLWIGVIAGGAFGAESGDFPGFCIGALFLGAVGFWIGRAVESFVIRLIFILSSIISILINSAIRRFLWELITSGS
jgi:hypothetical protein